MIKRKHILITGTGRAGTTFLVELLTSLGFDTGFDANDIKLKKHKLARAGLEHNILSDNCPHVVKDPWFCDYADKVLSRPDIELEHIFIPIRDLNAAAESRRNVTRSGLNQLSGIQKRKYFLGLRKGFPGGVWHTKSLKKNAQENILLHQLYKLMLSISNYNIKTTAIKYPKSVKDAAYLYRKLKPILIDIDFNQFSKVYRKTVQPDIVHSFNDMDR